MNADCARRAVHLKERQKQFITATPSLLFDFFHDATQMRDIESDYRVVEQDIAEVQQSAMSCYVHCWHYVHFSLLVMICCISTKQAAYLLKLILCGGWSRFRLVSRLQGRSKMSCHYQRKFSKEPRQRTRLSRT